jgi:hypothetical protein
MEVTLLPTKASFKMYVSLLSLNGASCLLLGSLRAVMTRPRVDKDCTRRMKKKKKTQIHMGVSCSSSFFWLGAVELENATRL